MNFVPWTLIKSLLICFERLGTGPTEASLLDLDLLQQQPFLVSVIESSSSMWTSWPAESSEFSVKGSAYSGAFSVGLILIRLLIFVMLRSSISLTESSLILLTLSSSVGPTFSAWPLIEHPSLVDGVMARADSSSIRLGGNRSILLTCTVA